MSPTQRSLAYLRNKGALVQIVEHWNSYAKIKMDLFGWIDLIALEDGKFVGVQTTTQDNASSRFHKARGNAALQAWVKSGGILVIHCWAKRGGRDERKLWTLKEWFLTPEDLV